MLIKQLFLSYFHGRRHYCRTMLNSVFFIYLYKFSAYWFRICAQAVLDRNKWCFYSIISGTKANGLYLEYTSLFTYTYCWSRWFVLWVYITVHVYYCSWIWKCRWFVPKVYSTVHLYNIVHIYDNINVYNIVHEYYRASVSYLKGIMTLCSSSDLCIFRKVLAKRHNI